MITLLYVDDEPSLLELSRLFLEKNEGFYVDTALSANDALAALSAKSYHAVISDYQMPGMDGIEFLKEVRSTYGKLPFILFTGKGREDVAIEALNHGANFYLQKGGNPKAQFTELAHIIQQAVAQRRMEKELRMSEERYRNVVEDQTEFICRFRPDGTHLFVNDAYARYFGILREDLTGKRFRPEIPLFDRERVARHLQSLTRNNPVATIEHRVILPGGEVRYHSWNDRAIFDEQGNISEFQSVGRDITDRIQVEDLLVQSERYLTDIFNFLPDATFAIDREGRVIAWNRALEEMTGVRAADIVGKGEYEYAIPFYGSRRPILADFILNPDLEPGANYQVTSRGLATIVAEAYAPIVRGKNSVLWAKASLLFDRQGNIVGAIEAIRDITQRKKTEETLRAERGRLAVTLKSIGDAVIVTDPSGSVSLMNHAAETLTGWTEPEALGRPLEEVFVIINEKTRERCENPVKKVLVTGGIAGIANHTALVAKDGSIRSISDSGAPVQDESGQLIGVVLVFRDVTEDRKMQEALRESEERLSFVLAGTRDGFFDWDYRTEQIMLSPRIYEMLGYAESEVPPDIGLWKNLIHPDDLGIVRSGISEILKKDTQDFRAEFRMRAKSGEYMWVLARSRVVQRDATGRPVRIAGTITDISGRKHTEKTLLYMNHRMNLINNITRHDLLNDLTTVLGYLTFIEDADSLDKAKEYGKKIEAGARKMQEHLAFTREYQEIGKNPPQFIPVEKALSKATIGLDLTEMKLSVELDDFEILADQLLEKVFANLIDNARRHGGTISRIHVSYRESETGLTLIVSDDGVGIPSGDKDSIFEKGFGKNHGLGLFLAKEILAITGISIKETGEHGEGATFEITIPPGNYRRKTPAG